MVSFTSFGIVYVQVSHGTRMVCPYIGHLYIDDPMLAFINDVYTLCLFSGMLTIYLLDFYRIRSPTQNISHSLQQKSGAVLPCTSEL
jgi:hypothetical protein